MKMNTITTITTITTIMDKYKFRRACRDGNLAEVKQIYYTDPIDPRKTTIVVASIQHVCMVILRLPNGFMNWEM